MRKSCWLLVFFSFIEFSYAQKHTISGYLKDALSGEVLPGANVYDYKSGKGTSTNNYGFYSLTLPQDSVRLVFSYVGYASVPQNFYLSANTVISHNLQPVTELNEVVVTAEKTQKIHETTQMSTIEIPIAQIKALPALLGEVDVLKVIQLLPGVQSGSEGSAGIYVRGGSPDQNLILLDGTPLYYVNHLGGFFSVFNADAISNVSLMKGGYPARYGGRLSSVIDIRMREGNMKKLHGQGAIGLVATRLSLEGPIIKDRTSFIFSARRTFLDLIMRPVSKMASDNQGSFGYYFYDLNGKINHIISPKDRLYLSFYSGDDRSITRIREKYQTSSNVENESLGRFKLAWGNVLTSLRWNHVFNEKLFGNFTANYTRYRLLIESRQETKTHNADGTTTQSSLFGYNSGIEDYNAKADMEWYPSPGHSVRFGGNAIRHTFRPGITAIRSSDTDAQSSDTTFGASNIGAVETAAYLEDDWEIAKHLKANFGLHFSTFFVNGKQYSSLQPRIAARYLFPKDYSLKASYATMQQYIHLLTNSDAGLPTDLWVPATGLVKPQWSQQWVLGAAKSFADNVYEASVETYYKDMRGLIEYKEGTSFFGNTADWQQSVETGGRGTSYGLELLLQKKTGRLNGWVGYTWSRTYRQFENLNFGREYPFKYDRRHDTGIAATYRINDRISISGDWVYGTGNATTLGVARYPVIADRPANNWPGSREWQYFNQAHVYEGRNGFRMRAYHRLDLGISFTKQKRWGERTWNLGLYNAYNRQNPYFYFLDYDKGRRRLKQFSLFPVIPSFSYNFKF